MPISPAITNPLFIRWVHTLSMWHHQGDSLKRPPRGYDPEARHIEDLKRKSFYLMSDVDVKLALSPALVIESARVFRTAAKHNRFITDALDLPF